MILLSSVEYESVLLTGHKLLLERTTSSLCLWLQHLHNLWKKASLSSFTLFWHSIHVRFSSPDWHSSSHTSQCHHFTTKHALLALHWRSSALSYILLNTGQRVSSLLTPQHCFQSVTVFRLVFCLLGRFSFPFLTLTSLSSLLANQLSLYPSELSSNVISSRKVHPLSLG